MAGKKWKVITLSCRKGYHTQAYQKELELRKKKGLIDQDVILLTVEDPDTRIGSGGATINTILVVAEHLSSLAGYTVVNPDVLNDADVLIFLMGKSYIFDPCGRAFASIPAMFNGSHHITGSKTENIATNIDFLIDTLTNIICPNSPPGVWVCSTDMLLSFSTEKAIATAFPKDWKGVSLITVPASIEYATLHGACKVGHDGAVDNIFYQSSSDNLQSCLVNDHQVPLVSGLLFMCPDTATKLLHFHVKPPIDACTYMGIDSGSQPIKLSLFFDILLPMANCVSRENFVTGNRSGSYGTKGDNYNQLLPEDKVLMENVRSVLYDELHQIQIRSVLINEGSHSYMSMDIATDYQNQILHCPLNNEVNNISNFHWQEKIHCNSQSKCKIPAQSVIINSKIDSIVDIGRKCIISHCVLQNNLKIGSGCILSGLLPEELEVDRVTTEPMVLPDESVLLNFIISIGDNVSRRITTVYGLHDNLMLPTYNEKSRFCNKPWSEFYKRTGIDSSDLWQQNSPQSARCLFNAKLYPIFNHSQKIETEDIFWLLGSHNSIEALEKWRSSWRLSLKDIMCMIDVAAVFDYRRKLYLEIGEKNIECALWNGDDICFLPFFQSCAAEDYHNILYTLDRVACETKSLAVASRCLASIADVLGTMAVSRGGLRSGPAANKSWKQAFRLLEERKVTDGVTVMAEERKNWLKRPDLIVRAARHYEGAEQILIRKAVLTAKEFITTISQELPPINDIWVIASSGARIDLAGGWSDTPPITYEHGGVVVNAAVKMDGKRPIGAKARRISDPIIRLVLIGDKKPTIVTCADISDLEDYNKPHAPGALLKAAFLCAEIISFNSSVSLKQQLLEKYSSGFELHSWAHLPQGSGLGTSSILAGAIMACLFTVSGRKCDNSSIVHSVLYLEQMLTTGGGWQDQVGGLVKGVKISRSPAELPLKVNITELDVKQSFITELDKRLLLVYTGKTRLAKNLLQDVLRGWYAKLPEVLPNVHNLTSNAEESAKAFLDGDLEKVGNCLNEYWQQKKKMAPGCEPVLVTEIMAALKPYSYGQSLAGAGGGGFMYLITKQENFYEEVKAIISKIKGTENVVVHRGAVDREGLTISFKQHGCGDSC